MDSLMAWPRLQSVQYGATQPTTLQAATRSNHWRRVPAGLGAGRVIAGCDWDALRQACRWLSEEQQRAALAYHAAPSDALDACLAADEGSEERVAELCRRFP
jgi:hypothetical protein